MSNKVKEHQRLQRLYDTAIPGSCPQCGMLIATAKSKNGVLVYHELDDESNPTLAPHKCPVAEAKKIAREAGMSMPAKLIGNGILKR